MKPEKLLDAIGMVGDDLIDEARAPQKKVIQWKHWTAIAACLALLITAFAIWNPLRPETPDIITQTAPPLEIAVPDLEISASPENTYIGAKPTDPTIGHGSLSYHFLYAVARAVEVLPDTYIRYDDWYSNPLRLVKMQTISHLEGKFIPDEFYLMLSEKYIVDLTQYEALILPFLQQHAAENSILYNVTQGSAEAMDCIVFSTPSLMGGSTIYAFNNGVFDESLWTINDLWAEDTEHDRLEWDDYASLIQSGTLEDVAAYLQEDYGPYYNRVDTLSLSNVTFQEGISVLEYLAPFKNGMFVSECSTHYPYYSPDYRRYIAGIPTNERIYISIENEEVFRYGTAFTEADMTQLPDVASAIVAVENAFQEGIITPPHIKSYHEMKCTSHGVIGWYFKSGDLVYGVVRISFTYRDEEAENTNKSLYDDLYFIMEPDSNICTEISRDELLQLQGTNDFIFSGQYDEKGKVHSGVSY